MEGREGGKGQTYIGRQRMVGMEMLSATQMIVKDFMMYVSVFFFRFEG